jgi:DNA helicase-2/ATP-dependent DNA helicase PcrA
LKESVNPYSASRAEEIQRVLQPATRVTLTKSYRSTWEIMQFALGVSPNPDLVAMERHGEPPKVFACKRASEATACLREEVEAFQSSPHQSLAIIAKTQKQAAKMHRQLSEAGIEARLLDAGSTSFTTGVVVCAAHLAKGLEFDRVIVPDASAQNYHTEMDRNLLYVACTRAMHRLGLIAVGELSALLPAELAA